MLRALIEAKLVAAIIPAPFKPLEALAMRLWKVLYTLSIGLGRCIRTIIQAPSHATVRPYKGLNALAGPVIADSILSTVKAMLGVQDVDIYENQGIVAVIDVAADTMVAVLAGAPSQCAESISAAILGAVFS